MTVKHGEARRIELDAWLKALSQAWGPEFASKYTYSTYVDTTSRLANMVLGQFLNDPGPPNSVTYTKSELAAQTKAMEAQTNYTRAEYDKIPANTELHSYAVGSFVDVSGGAAPTNEAEPRGTGKSKKKLSSYSPKKLPHSLLGGIKNPGVNSPPP